MVRPETLKITPWLPQDRKLPVAYFWYIVGVLLFAVTSPILQMEPVPFELGVIGVVVVAIAAFPITGWWVRGHMGVPMFELICLSYGLQYGVVLYLRPNQVRLSEGDLPLSWESTQVALFTAVLGIASLIASYEWARRLALFDRLPRLDLPFDTHRRAWYVALAFSIGIGGMLLVTLGVIKSTSPLAAGMAVFSGQALLALFLLTDYIYRHSVSWRWKLSLYVMLLLVVLIGLSKGMLEDVLMPVVIMLVARWQATSRFPWRVMLAGVLIFAVLEPIKSQYRIRAWRSGNAAALSLTERAAIWAEVLSGALPAAMATDAAAAPSGELIEEVEDKVRAVTLRLDLLHILAWVQEETPRWVPYYNGASYDYLVNTWVPRALWPEKPYAQQANITFALDYGFLNEEQIQSTSIGIGHIAEAYANFGVPGVLFVMMWQGVIFAALGRVLNGAESEGGRAIYTIVMVTFLQGIVSSAAGMFGGMVQNIIANALILRFFTCSFRAIPVCRQQIVGP